LSKRRNGSTAQNDCGRGLREAFEAWQVSADKIYQQYMSHPAFLCAGRMALDRTLDFYDFYLGASTAPGNDTEALSRNFKSFSSHNSSVAWQATVKILEMTQGKRLTPQVAATPYEVVYRENKLRLLRYQSSRKRMYPVPVLIIGSLVNKYYILDLMPGRSYVEHLLNEGFDVYMVDWGEPDDEDIKLSIEDYVEGYIPNMIREALNRSSAKEISLIGYSMGGVLSLIYTALKGEPVKNLTLLATPVDFSKASLFGAWTDRRYFDVDRFLETFGNVPAEMIHWSFRMLKPASNFTRVFNLLQHAHDEEEIKALLALEQWLMDSAPIPCEVYRDFVKALYQENQLAQDALKIGGRLVQLSHIKCAVLNVIGAHDQTVPPACSKPLLNLVGSGDKEELILPYGHVTLAVGSDAQDDFWSRSANWLKERSSNSKKSKSRHLSGTKAAISLVNS
jgi:polyhydroxyalkanoate synthase